MRRENITRIERLAIGRHCMALLALICIVAVCPSPVGGASHCATVQKYCTDHMKCSCECKPGTDKRRLHEPNPHTDYDDNNNPKFQDHYDVKCPTCNSFYSSRLPKKGRKKRYNIGDGYFCPVKNGWVGGDKL